MPTNEELQSDCHVTLWSAKLEWRWVFSRAVCAAHPSSIQPSACENKSLEIHITKGKRPVTSQVTRRQMVVGQSEQAIVGDGNVQRSQLDVGPSRTNATAPDDQKRFVPPPRPAMFRMERVMKQSGKAIELIAASFGDASTFVCLADKAKLAQTIRECGCDWAVPWTVDIRDANSALFDSKRDTKNSNNNNINSDNGSNNNHNLNNSDNNKNNKKNNNNNKHNSNEEKEEAMVVVLKPTRGCGGHGISFVSCLSDAHALVLQAGGQIAHNTEYNSRNNISNNADNITDDASSSVSSNTLLDRDYATAKSCPGGVRMSADLNDSPSSARTNAEMANNSNTPPAHYQSHGNTQPQPLNADEAERQQQQQTQQQQREDVHESSSRPVDTAKTVDSCEWVLQQHIESMLVADRRKFHIRAYVISIDNRVYVYTKEMEVRIAGAPYSSENWADRAAHITNGAGGNVTERTLLQLVPELVAIDAACRVLEFIRRLFASDALGGRLVASERQADSKCCAVAVSGLDLMMDAEQRVWLLESNGNPAAPSQGLLSAEFDAHLVQFATTLRDVSLYPNSKSAQALRGQIDQDEESSLELVVVLNAVATI